MNITCPKCSTIYKLDPKKLLPSGKTVKCVKCHNAWFEKYKKNSANEEIYRYPLPVVIKRKKKQSIPKRFIPITIITLAFLTAFIFFQDFFFEIAPASSRVYDKIGLPVTDNIILDHFEINKTEQNTIEINGSIINKSDQKRRVPALKITLIDKNNKIIKKIILKTPSIYFESNQKQPFFYKISNAPEDTHIVSIKIADKLEMIGMTK